MGKRAGSRRRGVAIGVLATGALVAGVFAFGSAGPAAAVTITSKCTTSIGITSDQSFDIVANVPASAPPGAPIAVTIPGGSVVLKATNVVPIYDYYNLYTKLGVSGGTFVTGSIAASGSPTWKGATVAGTVAIDSTTRLTFGTTGPLFTNKVDGTLGTPTITFQVMPTAAGTPVKILAVQAGSGVNIGTDNATHKTLVDATCLLGSGVNGAGAPTVLATTSIVDSTGSSTSTSTSTSTVAPTSTSTSTSTTVPPVTSTTVKGTTTTVKPGAWPQHCTGGDPNRCHDMHHPHHPHNPHNPHRPHNAHA